MVNFEGPNILEIVSLIFIVVGVISSSTNNCSMTASVLLVYFAMASNDVSNNFR